MMQTSSKSTCHQLSPVNRMSSFKSNHEQDFKMDSSMYTFSTNDEQSKWRRNSLKYHIESLLQ